MNSLQALLVIQMESDTRIPANAVEYVKDIRPSAAPDLIEDRLNMLERYVPDLVDQYREASD